MQLTITVKDGATNVDIAQALRFQANLIEGMDPKTAASRKATTRAAAVEEEETEETEEETDEDFAPKKKTAAKKAAASFDDDGEEEEETEEEAPAPKSKKAKKITIDDVNDACKARAAATGGKEGRNEVLKILKKNFKTESVSALKPEQFQAVIDAMEV